MAACDDRFDRGLHDANSLAHNALVPSMPTRAAFLGCGPAAAFSVCASYHPTRPFTVCLSCQTHADCKLHLTQVNPIGLAPIPTMDIAPRPAGNKNYAVTMPDRIANVFGGVAPDFWSYAPTPGQGIIPPQLSGVSENPPFHGFLARLCSECEHMIRSEQDLRSTMMLARAPFPSVHDKWESYPLNSCTCKWELGMLPMAPWPNPVLCFRHRQNLLMELEKKKDRNDTWLRNVQRHPTAGNLRKADQATLTTRRVNGTWRACRCGREIDVLMGNIAEAFLCMACEGWVSIQPTAASRFHPNNAGPGNPNPQFVDTAQLERYQKGVGKKANLKLSRKRI